jgi:hypothetical protein
MLEQIYTASKIISINQSWTYFGVVYLQTWDALVCKDYSKGYKLFRDGTKVLMLESLPAVSLIARERGRHAWFANSSGWIYGADEITSNYHLSDVLNPNWAWPVGSLTFQGAFIDDRNGLLLTANLHGIIRRYNLETGTEILPYLTLADVTYDQMAWAGAGLVLVGGKASGRVALIDYLTWQVVWQSSVRPCAAMAYDSLHDLIITVESDGLVRLYILDPVPAKLSAPEFLPNTLTQYRLMGSRVKTQLTGDVGEAIPNRVVTWSLLNSKGYLEKAQTLTDKDGWTENYYYGPDVSGVIGAETIQVEADT